MSLPAQPLRRHDLVRESSRVQRALGELLRVLQFHDRIRVRSYDLSVSQCHALQVLVQAGPMTVTDLGDHLYLEKSTASRLAKGLLEKKLIRRRAPRADGRVSILQLTESGQRLARRILNDLNEEYMSLLENFDPAIRRALPGLLEELTGTLGTEAVQASTAGDPTR